MSSFNYQETARDCAEIADLQFQALKKSPVARAIVGVGVVANVVNGRLLDAGILAGLWLGSKQVAKVVGHASALTGLADDKARAGWAWLKAKCHKTAVAPYLTPAAEAPVEPAAGTETIPMVVPVS